MSRITFMIGNGFDRQLGLDTGYDQFVHWYIQQPSANEKIRQFKKELQNNPQSEWWSDAEIAMGRYVKNYSIGTLPVFYNILEDFKKQLVNYLREQERRCDFSDEKAIGDAFADFLLNFQTDIVLPGRVGNRFSRENGIVFNFLTFNYTNVLAKLIEIAKATRPGGILYKNPNASPWGDAEGTIENIFSVHGNLNSLLVMGVNDDGQIDFPPAAVTSALRKILVKPQFIDTAGYEETAAGEEVLNSSDTIAIYGLKLGDSDAIWKERLWKWFQDPLHIVVLFGHADLPNATSPVVDTHLRYEDEKQIEFIENISPDIGDYWIEFYRKRVFVIPRTTHLNLNLIRK